MTDPTSSHETTPDLIERALDAYTDLLALGEEVEDEWSYVNDLEASWRERLDSVAAGAADRLAPPGAAAAIDRAIDEIGRIRDPHRAIDWLSTFPAVVLIALGEAP